MREVLLVQLVQLACPVDLALRVLRVLLERKEPLVKKGHKVQLAVMVSRVLSACLDPLDPRDHLVRMVTRERLESLVRKEAKLTKESRVLLAQLASKVP